MFSFGLSRCLPIEEGTMSTLAAKQNLSRGCFFRHLAAYHLRKKIFFLLGLPFTPPYLRIYVGIFRAAFRPEVMATKTTSKIFFCRSYDLGVLNVRIYEGGYLRTVRSDFWLKGDEHKRHLGKFTVCGVTLTPSNVRICERIFLRHSLIRKLPLR